MSLSLPRMPRLNSLPHEILLNILDSIGKDMRTLCSLALAVRAFSPLIAKYLYREIQILVEDADIGETTNKRLRYEVTH